jgi:hypothetical protein
MSVVPSFWRGDLDLGVQISAPKREGASAVNGFQQRAPGPQTINLYLKVNSYPRIRA